MNTIRGSEFTPWMSSRSFLSMSFIISTFSSRHRRAKEFFLAHSPATMPELPTRWSVIFLNGFSLRSLCVKLRPQLRPHAQSPHGTILAGGVRCYERRDRRAAGMAGSLSRYSLAFPLHTPVLGMATATSSFSRYHPLSSAICAVVTAVRLHGADPKVHGCWGRRWPVVRPCHMASDRSLSGQGTTFAFILRFLLECVRT